MADGIPILYEDDALLVCVKPRGLLSAKDASGKPAVTDGLPAGELYPVHRLDREATGLMVFAKTAESAAFLSDAMGKAVRKEYLAVCEGQPAPSGELTDLLYHDRMKNKTYVVQRKRNGVREARLSYEVLRGGKTSLLHVILHTGRTHQIRVQFGSRGFPLCGDRKYGAKTGGDLQLYAWKLTFPHPDGRTLSFTLPEAFCPPETKG